MVPQVLQLLGQAAQWVYLNPYPTHVVVRLFMGARQFYDSLSPEQKAELDRVIRLGGQMLLRHALPDVLGAVGEMAVTAVGNPQAGEFARAVVTRGASIGIERALEEAKRG